MTSNTSQYWFTARELASLASARGLSGFPSTERGVQILAGREAWAAMPPTLARWRKTAGRPAMEYHLSILPEHVQISIVIGGQPFVRQNATQSGSATVHREISAIPDGALSRRALMAMAARAEILTSIDGFAAAQGQSRAWGIMTFLEAQEAWAARQDIEQRRNAGEALTPREVQSLAPPLLLIAPDGFGLDPAWIAVANDRRGNGVSRPTIYKWFAARDERGVGALAPLPTKTVRPIPPEFGKFLRCYVLPTRPSVVEAYAEYLRTSSAQPGAQPAPISLDQVRYILRERLQSHDNQVIECLRQRGSL